MGKPKSVGRLPLTSRQESPSSSLRMEQGNSYSSLQEQLGKSYDVRPLALADSTQLDSTSVIVLAGAPETAPPDQIARLQRFVDRGGSVLVLSGGMTVSPQEPLATPHPVPWNPVLERFGLGIRSDMVYDLVANEAVPLPSAFGQVLQVYPFFIRAESTRRSAVNQDLGAAVMTCRGDPAGAEGRRERQPA